ncbi:MAG: hypothetical protein ABW034_12095 [Steroidobacteraceae bacterium]
MFARNLAFAIIVLTYFVAPTQLQAQSEIVFSQRIEPSAEDLQSAPEFTNIDFGAAVAIDGQTALAAMHR